MTTNKLDIMRDTNMTIFSRYKDFVNKERDLYKNDIEIANYFIKNNFNLDQILKKYKIVAGKKDYGPNIKMESLINLRKSYLNGIINDIDKVVEEIEKFDSKNQFYESLKSILFELKVIYDDNLSYFKEGEKSIDIDEFLNVYLNKQSNPDMDYSYVNKVNANLLSSNNLFKKTTESIEKHAMELINFLDNSSNIDKNIKEDLINLIESRHQTTLKMVVRSLSFNFLDTIILLCLSGKPSDNVVEDKKNAAKDSNLIVGELVELLNSELVIVNNIYNFFQSSPKGSILLVDNEFKYFNTVDKNTNSLINFCKKMKKLDKSKNSDLIFKRMAKEFIKKKNNQITKLNKDIDQIMGDMTVTDAYNHNLYTLRTSDQSQKQINAIKQAKENIDSIGKFKINLK